MDDMQCVHEADPVGVNTGLESRLVHQEANRIVSDQQPVQLLNDADRLQAAQRATGQALMSQ